MLVEAFRVVEIKPVAAVAGPKKRDWKRLLRPSTRAATRPPCNVEARSRARTAGLACCSAVRPSARQRRANVAEHPGDGGAAFLDRDRRAVVLEGTERTEARREKHVRRLDCEPPVRDAFLHDGDRAQEGIAHRGQRSAMVSRVDRAGAPALERAAKPAAVGGAVGGDSLHRREAADAIRPGIDRDDHVRTHRATERDRYRVDDAPVHEEGAAPPDGLEQSGNGAGRADGFRYLALAQPHLFSGREVGCNGAEGHGQLGKLASRGDLPVKEVEQSVALDEAAAKAEVDQSEDAFAVERQSPRLELLDPAGGVGGPDDRPHRAARDDVSPDSLFDERAKHAHVRPAARRAAAQCEPDPRLPGGHCSAREPESGTAAPLMGRPSSEARKTNTFAQSSGATQRAGSAPGIAARFSGVSRIVGRTQFTVIFLSRSSAAIASVTRSTTLLAEQYAPISATPCSAACAPTLMMLPPRPRIMCGTVARTVLSSVRTLTSKRNDHSSSVPSCTVAPARKPPTMLHTTSMLPKRATAPRIAAST